MEQDLFKILPSELTANILSRLPLRSISISKCVSKPWLNLLQSDDFVKSKIKTPPAVARLIPMTENSTQCTIFGFKDQDEADVESHALHFRPLTDLDIPHGNLASIYRARQTNGLLLLYSSVECYIYICNPITRQYIELCCPVEYISIYVLSFGFGVSKISGQYKVVCINVFGSDPYSVYTLGTGTWRRVEPGPASGCKFDFHAYVECNGNLHWIAYDSAKIFWICAFDLETECFSTLAAPTVDELAVDVKLNVWRDCLCLSYTLDHKVVIWLMKEYQVEESWTMKYQISTIDFAWNTMNVCPIKIFENGDVLMYPEEMCFIYYSNKTRTNRLIGMLTDATSEDDISSFMIYTPSLFSLKNFGVENVISF
ncbi:F-box protein-like protein [Salvia divinorum]|uniref:F-box protein-like protein n=1 Tax=Salvia divinorum TaxID=28513 RepID=A0ABD1FPH7_SALDI